MTNMTQRNNEDVKWFRERINLIKSKKKTLNSDKLSGGERQRTAAASNYLPKPLEIQEKHRV